jgi:hypothetical protein
MITLTNNTKSNSIVGKLVSIDGTNPNAFTYAIPNSSRAVGICLESVPYRSKCKIATIGDKAQVLVQGNVLKDDILRAAKSGDNVSLGTCKIAKAGDAPYLLVGTALTSGSGLIDTILELTYSGSNGSSAYLGEEFETVSKNLKSYPYVLTYGVDGIDTITYDLGGGLSVVKTFNYTLTVLTSIVLSGDTPSGIELTKTLSYTGADLTGVVYS